MQGVKPCKRCPYGFSCDRCPEETAEKDSTAAAGYYSQEVRRIVDSDGNEHFVYSHPE